LVLLVLCYSNSGFVLVDKLSGVHAFLFIMTNLYIEQFKQISVFCIFQDKILGLRLN